MSPTPSGRRAGIALPLFSCPSTSSWGIGDIGDLPGLSAWLARAGLRVLQLLPVNEMAPGQQSPYSAISAMAIDPIYVRLPDLADFAALGGEDSLEAADREALADVRASGVVCYEAVRDLKDRALAAAYEWFRDREWSRGAARADAFAQYAAAQAWWLDDYAVFRAVHADLGEQPWTVWPAGLARRDPAALREARRQLADQIRFRQYLQWVADVQWHDARARANGLGVALFGDLPFMVDGDSADVWSHLPCFRLDASVGVPPDAFSETGQDWGMPVYRWDVLAANGYRWLHERARRSADLFDGYRVDHLVGFYRTYGRPRGGGEPFFTPETEEEQTNLGERILSIFTDAGAEIIAEDLGTVPDFVRASLARLNVPGFRVIRWERVWEEPDQPFRDPIEYPACSVATSGTHDTEPMIAWWEQATDQERALVAATPTMRRVARGEPLVEAPYDPVVRDALLEALFASGSDLVLVLMQDVFGSRERINVPGTVSPTNWTYRLPWRSERLDEEPSVRERRDRLRAWAVQYGRA